MEGRQSLAQFINPAEVGEVDDSCVSSVCVVVEPRDSSDLCSGRRRESEGLQSNH